MKKYSYLIVLVLFLGLVLAGCSLLSNISQVPATGQSGITYLTKNGILNPDLVALWHFDDNALDSSVNSNDGDVHGATYVDGKFGKALSFNGVNDYVDCGTGASLTLTTLTIEMWIYPDVIKEAYILSKAGTGTNKNYYIYLYSDGRIEGGVFDTLGADRASPTVSAGQIVAGQWQHIAYTYDGVDGIFYINGVLKATESWSGTVGTATTPLLVGQRLGGYYFDGIIDEVRIYDYALSLSTIKGHAAGIYGFNGLLAPYTPPSQKAFKLGSTIPLKWQYTDPAGNVVDSAGANPTVEWAYTGSGSDTTGILVEVDAPGASGLQYDALTMTWQFNWQTKDRQVGTYNITITSDQAESSGIFPIALRK